MPFHLYLITSNKETHNLSEIMRNFKNVTSKEIKSKLIEDTRNAFLQIFANAAENLPKQQYKIWQGDFHPVALFSDKWFNEKMEYIHYNPVRKGFVEQPEHWKFISARNWLSGDDSIIEIDREFIVYTGQSPDTFPAQGHSPRAILEISVYLQKTCSHVVSVQL